MTVGLNERVLVTIGDPNGIGPEIAVKAAVHMSDLGYQRPILIGDLEVIKAYSDPFHISLATSAEYWSDCGRQLDIFPVDAMPLGSMKPGNISADAGAATISYVKSALSLLSNGIGKAIIGCPHSEQSVNLSGHKFSGYPNLLGELMNTGPDSVFLMLIGGGLRIVHVTLHESITSALARLTPDLVVNATLAGVSGLKKLGIEQPRIGIFGINPHAGENGLFGHEDKEILEPAIESLKNRGLRVEGPEGGDVLLLRDGYDAFVAMYHDQGHIPVKLVAGRTSSAMAVGSDVLFSTVGHGAAFDIAGKGVADPGALVGTMEILGGPQ